MLNKTPLHQTHIDINAQMVDFYGWSMPLNYGSQIKEHNAVREHCGLFDVSHMGLVDITGADSKSFFKLFLLMILKNVLIKAHYTHVCLILMDL